MLIGVTGTVQQDIYYFPIHTYQQPVQFTRRGIYEFIVTAVFFDLDPDSAIALRKEWKELPYALVSFSPQTITQRINGALPNIPPI